MTITTVPEPPPAVGIAGGRSDEVAAKIPGGATFRLRGVVAGGGAYSYAWSIARGGVTCGATLCDASVVADNATFISEVALNAINLFVPPGHLLPGAEYRFQLSATRRSDGKLGYAAVDVTVNRPPYGGSLEVSPRNGTVLVDDFEVKASSWIDDNADDYPLTYTFYYRRASGSYGSEQLPLGQPGYSTVQIVQMPIAGDLEIVASVADQMRGAAITDGVPVGVAWNLTDDSAGAAIAQAQSVMDAQLETALGNEDAAAAQLAISCARRPS